MKKTLSILLLLSISVCFFAQRQPVKVTSMNGIPRLTQDGKPVLMVAGEIHNSTSSTDYSLTRVWATLDSMGLNTVLVPVTWEQLEPEPGIFNFTLADRIISLANQHRMHAVILWFGTWKNGESSYVPLWVKRDVKRFFRVKDRQGNTTTTISPFCNAACEADAKAFARLMEHICLNDTERWIAAVQVENEVGCFVERDYSHAANKAWKGDGSRESMRRFMTTAYARYVEKVAKAGKNSYNIPMFANCWLAQQDQPFGDFPNGGPQPYVLDIWKKEAPSLDWLSPDLYQYGNTFKEICSDYNRKDNMLFIPETGPYPSRMWYAFAEYDAQCFSPFAIEDYYSDDFFTGSVGVLKELLPTISRFQGTGKMRAFFRVGNEDSTTIDIGDYHFTIYYIKELKQHFGMIVQLNDNEFLLSGMGARVFISNKKKNLITRFTNIRDVERQGENWKTVCLMNGDQTKHNGCVNLRGRTKNENHGRIPAPLTDVSYTRITFDYNIGRFTLPGIYLADIYSISRR